MKKEISKGICVRLLWIYMVSAALSYSVSTNDYMAFDDPYPVTPLRSLLATCAQLWQLYDCLNQEPHQASPIITDAIIGCSLRFTEEITLFLHQEQNRHTVHNGDIDYLARIVEQLVFMHDQAKKCINFHPCVIQNLSSIQHTLNML